MVAVKDHINFFKKTTVGVMEYGFTHLHETSQECQFLMSDWLKSMNNDYKTDISTIKLRLKPTKEMKYCCSKISGHCFN